MNESQQMCNQVCRLFLFTLVFASGCASKEASDSSKPETTILTVEARTVKQEPSFSYPVTYYGRICPVRRSVLAFESPGQIAEICVDEGESVATGDVLARLDTRILDAERKRLLAAQAVEQTVLKRLEAGERKELIDAARATVDKLSVDIGLAIRERERAKQLIGYISQSELDSAEFEVRALEASKASATSRLSELENGSRKEDIDAQASRVLEIEAQIEVLDAKLEKTSIRAPFAGQITERFVDEGTTVQAGNQLLVLSESGLFEARFALPQMQIAESRLAEAVRVDGRCYRVSDVRIVSTVSLSTRTVEVIYRLPKSAQLNEGQSCELLLSKQVETSGFHIPIESLVPSIRGLWSVYRLDRTQEPGRYRVHREDVTVNHTDGATAFIEGSLSDQSLIVSKGVHKIVPGMHVQLKENVQ